MQEPTEEHPGQGSGSGVRSHDVDVHSITLTHSHAATAARVRASFHLGDTLQEYLDYFFEAGVLPDELEDGQEANRYGPSPHAANATHSHSKHGGML